MKKLVHMESRKWSMLCNTCYLVVWGWGWYWVVANTYSLACHWERRTHWQGSLSWWRWSESDMVTLTCRSQVVTCRHCRNRTDHRHEERRDELVKTLVHQNNVIITTQQGFLGSHNWEISWTKSANNKGDKTVPSLTPEQILNTKEQLPTSTLPVLLLLIQNVHNSCQKPHWASCITVGKWESR